VWLQQVIDEDIEGYGISGNFKCWESVNYRIGRFK
jgi:hypothetical protein